MREGFTSNYVKGGVLFAKASRGGRALKEIKEKGGVLGIIALLLPPSHDQNRGEGGGARRRRLAAWGLGGGSE
jgi:hypothetical protein